MAAAQAFQTEIRELDLTETVPDPVLAAQTVSDPYAFGELYLRYVDRVYRHCYRKLGSREAAENATSLVFTKALSAIGRFDGSRGTFAAWLFTIANNVLTDQFRAERHYRAVSEMPEQIDPARSPEEVAVAREQAGDLRNALAMLTPREREVIELRLAGLGSAEISEVLGCRKNTVAQAQFRAIGRLRGLLGAGATQQGKDNV
jgi:RNA polymerase sigma-70 factor (ECF subfamily)